MMLIFAHYWGIDEVGIFVIPALAAIFSLRWAERRARRAAEERKLKEDSIQEPTDVD
ncbi:MAG: hypothetical protein WD895_04565 [Acidimicrobiia bacterium]